MQSVASPERKKCGQTPPPSPRPQIFPGAQTTVNQVASRKISQSVQLWVTVCLTWTGTHAIRGPRPQDRGPGHGHLDLRARAPRVTTGSTRSLPGQPRSGRPLGPLDRSSSVDVQPTSGQGPRDLGLGSAMEKIKTERRRRAE
jgi:hypothetical protein